jgi:hypothetical protein
LEFVEEGFFAVAIVALTEEILGGLMDFHVAYIVAVAVGQGREVVRLAICAFLYVSELTWQ